MSALPDWADGDVSALPSDRTVTGRVPENRIMRQTRHRSRAMLDVYVREGSMFRGNAAASVGL